MRVLAIFFFLVAAISLAWDLFRWGGRGVVYLVDLGSDWRALHAASFDALQPTVQRYVTPETWEGFFQPVLQMPATLLFAGIGLICLVIHALVNRRGRRRFS